MGRLDRLLGDLAEPLDEALDRTGLGPPLAKVLAALLEPVSDLPQPVVDEQFLAQVVQRFEPAKGRVILAQHSPAEPMDRSDVNLG